MDAIVRDEGVAGSNPATPTNHLAGIASSSHTTSATSYSGVHYGVRWDYEADTGVLRRAGEPRGYRKLGYLWVRFGPKVVAVHRVAWLLVHGVWPERHIDHVSGDGEDNRLCNLRAATPPQNMANIGPMRNNTSGFKGVSRHHGRWRATCRVGPGGAKHLGYFDSREDAAAAYDVYLREHKGSFARTNGVGA